MGVEKYAELLELKGALKPCERCGSSNLRLQENYFLHDYHEDHQNGKYGGPAVPTISVCCTNCGNLSFHAIALLES